MAQPPYSAQQSMWWGEEHERQGRYGGPSIADWQ
jgi:hypothetical protein